MFQVQIPCISLLSLVDLTVEIEYPFSGRKTLQLSECDPCQIGWASWYLKRQCCSTDCESAAVTRRQNLSILSSAIRESNPRSLLGNQLLKDSSDRGCNIKFSLRLASSVAKPLSSGFQSLFGLGRARFPTKVHPFGFFISREKRTIRS